MSFARTWTVAAMLAALTPGHAGEPARTAEAAPRNDTANTDRLLARIGDREIRLSELIRSMAEGPELERPRVGDEDTLVAMVRRYVTDEVIWEKARRAGETKGEGLSRRDIINRFVTAEIEKELQRDPPDVERYYREHIKAYTEPNQAKVQVIKLPNKASAEKLLELIGRGTEFGAAAKQVSVTTEGLVAGPVSMMADDWGLVMGIGSFPAATPAIFALKTGEVTPRAFERAGTWYVFKLETILPNRSKPFAEMKHKVTESCLDARRKELKPIVITAALKEARAELLLRPPGAPAGSRL